MSAFGRTYQGSQLDYQARIWIVGRTLALGQSGEGPGSAFHEARSHEHSVFGEAKCAG